MTKAIVTALSYILGWAAAKGLDILVGKWIAYFTVAWEISATARGKAAFRDGLAQIRKNMPDKYLQWQQWRKKVKLLSNEYPKT